MAWGLLTNKNYRHWISFSPVMWMVYYFVNAKLPSVVCVRLVKSDCTSGISTGQYMSRYRFPLCWTKMIRYDSMAGIGSTIHPASPPTGTWVHLKVDGSATENSFKKASACSRRGLSDASAKSTENVAWIGSTLSSTASLSATYSKVISIWSSSAS